MRAANSPKFHKNVVTLPEVDGVQWQVDGQTVSPGKLKELNPGDTVTVEAILDDGVVTSGTTRWTFSVPAEQTDATNVVETPQQERQRLETVVPPEVSE